MTGKRNEGTKRRGRSDLKTKEEERSLISRHVMRRKDDEEEKKAQDVLNISEENQRIKDGRKNGKGAERRKRKM